MGLKRVSSEPELILNPKSFFGELVDEGLERRHVKVAAPVRGYLVSMLEHYMLAQNLFESSTGEASEKKNSTLAEMLLQAGQKSVPERQEILKKLGDKSLYISGFFGDSLERSLVDIDYYAEMGGAAYGWLAESVSEETVAVIYRTYSKRFLEFVDVLTYISQRSLVQTDQSLLRLYDRYLRTGSELAREQLAEHGVVPLHRDQLKGSKQD